MKVDFDYNIEDTVYYPWKTGNEIEPNKGLEVRQGVIFGFSIRKGHKGELLKSVDFRGRNGIPLEYVSDKKEVVEQLIQKWIKDENAEIERLGMINIKSKLKERFLEIPLNGGAFREKHRLAVDLNIELKEIELYLNELCEKGILVKKIEYICPNCRDTTIMDDKMLNEILEDGFFECDNCCDYVDPNKDKTGFIYYNIHNKVDLINW